jgi:hypothetical protein
MNKRPLSMTIIGCVYIATGAIGLADQFTQFRGQHLFQYDIIGIGLIRLVAVVSGVYILRGHDWARWLALAWIAFHVILSAFHTLRELAIHSLLFAILAYFLFRPAATRYFRAAGTQERSSG